MNVMELKNGDRVKAVRPIHDGTDEVSSLMANTGDVGVVVHSANNVDSWPTVRFGLGVTIVFDDDVARA